MLSANEPPGFPLSGEGGATQLLAADVEIPISKIFDISVSPPVQVYP